MKEYRPIKVPNPFTNYYIFGGVFLFIISISIIQGKIKNMMLMLGITAVLGIISFLIIRTAKYAVLVRFDNSFLRIEYFDYRKRSFFMQIPYVELSAEISLDRIKYQTYAVLKIARNGKRVISIDENNSNFSRTEITDIYKDILKLNPSNG